MLRKKDKGQEVKRLQLNLGISADGDFGPKTDVAVRDYQKANGLSADGIAGPATLGALGIPVLYGVDLSRHNGTVDFAAMASSGVKFAWVKLTEGTTHTNPGFEEKFRGCRDHGIIVGAYHFGRPDTYVNDPTDAKDEVDNFLNSLTLSLFNFLPSLLSLLSSSSLSDDDDTSSSSESPSESSLLSYFIESNSGNSIALSTVSKISEITSLFVSSGSEFSESLGWA